MGLHGAQRDIIQQKQDVLQGELVHRLAGAWVLTQGGGRADAEGSWSRSAQRA